jgi:hypothetical protein
MLSTFIFFNVGQMTMLELDMINNLLKKEWYGDLKRRAEDRQEWRAWLPGTCHMAGQSY